MNEIVVDPLAPPTDLGNLSDIPHDRAAREPGRVVFERRGEPGSGVGDADRPWTQVTAEQFLAEVRGVAKGLLAAGLEPGDRVGIMSRTRYEWTLLDFAIWTAGLVTVPVYETSSAGQLEWVMSDSETHALFVETPEHARIASEVRDALPQLRQVWQIDNGAVEELTAAGAEIDDATLDERRRLAQRHDLATIIYTSGTTGRPKGCELTHGNFLDLSENVVAALPEVVADGSATILFLPLAHVLARLIEVTATLAGVRIGHSPDVKNLMPDLQSFHPTFLLAVPRVFEKIYNATDQKLGAEGKGRLFRLATRTAIAYSRALDSGRVPVALRLQHKLFDALVYSKLRALMGGRVRWAVSGGAPLVPRLAHFFRGIGVVVLEGYGLTETTAPTNVGTPSMLKVGTVGRPLPGVGIRIAEDGEILVRGVGVFAGYRGDEKATREAMTDDGWFHTGDLGELDDDGCLSITGRKKEIIVTAGGKNVAPSGLEDLVRTHPLVSQCVVVGDGRPFIGALVTIDSDMVESWGKAHGRPDLTAESAVDDEMVREHIQMAVDRANRNVSRAESIRKFTVLDGDFTEDSGHLTASLKVKRDVVAKDYADAIDRLYSGSPPSQERPAQDHPAH